MSFKEGHKTPGKQPDIIKIHRAAACCTAFPPWMRSMNPAKPTLFKKNGVVSAVVGTCPGWIDYIKQLRYTEPWQ
jgi:hypothetical protein